MPARNIWELTIHSPLNKIYILELDWLFALVRVGKGTLLVLVRWQSSK
jgi:hypothetical protein